MVGESEPNDRPECRADDGTSITGDVVSLSILVHEVMALQVFYKNLLLQAKYTLCAHPCNVWYSQVSEATSGRCSAK